MHRLRSNASRLLGDGKIAVRRLRRAPLFTATAVLVLGLGIGVGTTFFNVINAGVFKGRASLPGAVRFVASNWPPGLSGLLGRADVAAVAEHPPTSLTWVVGLGSARQTTARILGTSIRLRADGVSGPYFKVFGATPIAGRLLDAGDDRSELTAAAVISERLWRTRFSADPTIVGSTAYIGGQPLVIVGVVGRPPFAGLASVPATDVWVPSRIIPVDQLYGRLREGVTLREADQAIRSQYPMPVEGAAERRLALEAGFEPALPSSAATVLVAILALGVLVLVIAGASLTLLLLARILGSQADIGVRLMLGARLFDVARLWAIEVLLISTTATIVGLTVGSWLARVALNQFSAVAGIDTSTVDVSPDWRVVLYATGLTLIVAVGIIAALTRRISTVGTIAAATASAGTAAMTARNGDARGRLMAAQIAIATCLLLVSVYLLRNTMTTEHIDPGFDASSVVVARLDQTGRDSRTLDNNRRALVAAARTPGIDHAALATRLVARSSSMARTGTTTRSRFVQPVGVTPEFFDVLHVDVARGRSFSAADEDSASAVAIVSARTAGAFWPNMDPVGLLLWLQQRGGTYSPVQIIGVVRDLLPDVQGRPSLDVYLPYRYETARVQTQTALLLARGPGLPQELGQRLLAQMSSDEPQVGVATVRSMDDEVRGDAGPANLFSRLLAALGFIGLVLAVTGLYGLTAFLATQRRREFGIRKALGATNLLLSTMVAFEGCLPLLKGAGLGAGMAVFIGYWLRARSFPTLAPFDWLALAVVGPLLLVVGLVGTVLPFRRILRAEASQMLRED